MPCSLSFQLLFARSLSKSPFFDITYIPWEDFSQAILHNTSFLDDIDLVQQAGKRRDRQMSGTHDLLRRSTPHFIRSPVLKPELLFVIPRIYSPRTSSLLVCRSLSCCLLIHVSLLCLGLWDKLVKFKIGLLRPSMKTSDSLTTHRYVRTRLTSTPLHR